MTLLIDQPKSTYLLQPHQTDLHREATDWLSDLEFCKTELVFLNKLLDKSILRTKGTQKLSDLVKFEKKVKSFRSTTLKTIHNEVILHEQRLGALDENVFSQDEQAIRDEHKRISLSVNSFMGSVRKIKKEIFDFIERELKRAKTKK